MAFTTPVTYMPIPPPPLPEFYLPRTEDEDANTSSSSSSSSSDGTIGQTNYPDITTHRAVAFPSPLTGDDIYDGGPNRFPGELSGSLFPIITATPQDVLAMQMQITPIIHPPPIAILHICPICLRPRSPKYHFQNPIPANGVPPPPSICRRCRVATVEEKPPSTRQKTTVEICEQQQSEDVKLGVKCLVSDNDIVTNEEYRGRNAEALVARKISRPTNNHPPRNVVYRYVQPSQPLTRGSTQRRQLSSNSSSPPTSSSSSSLSKSSEVPRKSKALICPDVRTFVRNEVDRLNRQNREYCLTSDQIRTLARDEIEKYRSAERKLASHPRPYDYGRPVRIPSVDQLKGEAEVQEPTQKHASFVRTRFDEPVARKISDAPPSRTTGGPPNIEPRMPEWKWTVSKTTETKDKRDMKRDLKPASVSIQTLLSPSETPNIPAKPQQNLNGHATVAYITDRDEKPSSAEGRKKPEDRSRTKNSNNEEPGIWEVIPPNDPDDPAFNDLLHQTTARPFSELVHVTPDLSSEAFIKDGVSDGVPERVTGGIKTRDLVRDRARKDRAKSDAQASRQGRDQHPGEDKSIKERWIPDAELTKHRQDIYDRQNRHRNASSSHRSDSKVGHAESNSHSHKDKEKLRKARYNDSTPRNMGEANRVQFSNTVVVSPTPPNSDAHSSEFRSFRVSERGTTKPLKNREHDHHAEDRLKQNAGRGRSRGHEDRRREKNHGPTQPPRYPEHRRSTSLDSALSESPSRESSVERSGS